MPKLGLGLNLSVPGVGGGGGAGFPDVASTNQIRVTSVTGTIFNVANNGIGTYTKNGPLNLNIEGGHSPYYAFDTANNAGIGFRNGQWYLFGYYDDPFDYSTNPSTDPTTIPTTGWSPSLTITAA